MDEEPSITNEQDIAKKVESPELDLDKAIQMLESPPDGDFVAGLNAFIAWIQSLIAKKD